MKKLLPPILPILILISTLVILPILSIEAKAQEQSEKFKFSGMIWIVNWYVNNGDFNSDIKDDDNGMYGRITLACDIDLGRNITGHIAILQEAFWLGGIGPTERGWYENPGFARAYLKINKIFGSNFSFSLGRLPFGARRYGEGLVLDDFINMGYDGVRITYEGEKNNTEFFAAKVKDEGRADKELNIFGIYSISNLLNNRLKLYNYFMHTQNSNDRNTWKTMRDSRNYIGIRVEYDIIEGLNYTGEFAYLFGRDKERDVDRRAYAFTNKLAYKWSYFRLGGGYYIATGDNEETQNNELFSNAFGTPYFPECTRQWPGFTDAVYFGRGYVEDFVYEPSDDKILNLFIQFFPTKKDWDIRLDYLKYKKYWAAPEQSDDLGMEIKLSAGWNIRGIISPVIIFSYFKPGDGLVNNPLAPKDPIICFRTAFFMGF